jgi:NAD(P)-dependent dehydrogenase (short-subunit alcohol dehydrogenase family)
VTLADQRIVIIGGSSGMGLATARAAAAAGAAVTIASTDQGRLDTALAGLPGNCDGAVADTRSEADVAALFARVGELDHLVYTANGAPPARRPLKDLSLDEARQQFEVSFWGAVAAVKHAAPRLRPGGSGPSASARRPAPRSQPAVPAPSRA